MRFVLGRLLAIIPVLIGASIFAFSLAHLAPGDVTSVMLGPYASPEQKGALQQQLALDKPLVVQYGRWLANAARGDLGDSVTLHQPVSTVLADRFSNTFVLAAVVFGVAFALGVAAGVLSAVRFGSKTDRSIHAGVAFMAYMPVFWLAVVLVYLFSFRLGWFPAVGSGPIEGGGDPLERVRYLVLPVVATIGIPAALIARSTRSAVKHELESDFVRTARAKGLTERTVIIRHALRAAFPAILHVGGLQFAYLFAGSIVFTEVVFNWPGIGLAVYDAVVARDIPVVQGVVLLAALVTIFANLAVDLIHAAIDPRVRMGGGAA